MNLVKNFIKEESGATAAEYAIMVATVAVLIIVGFTALRNAINAKMNETATAIKAGG